MVAWGVVGRRLRGGVGVVVAKRYRQYEVIDHLVDAVRGGGSRVLVVRGEPGVGKSALL